MTIVRDPECALCQKLEAPTGLVFQNELWQVRTIDTPTPVPGWVLLISQRHVSGPAFLNELEVRSFGPTLQHLQRLLLDVTGALRIYTAALGEAVPHLHVHSVPRYAEMPKDAKGWSVFDLQRAAAAGEYPVDEDAAARVIDAYRAALTLSPPP